MCLCVFSEFVIVGWGSYLCRFKASCECVCLNVAFVTNQCFGHIFRSLFCMLINSVSGNIFHNKANK